MRLLELQAAVGVWHGQQWEIPEFGDERQIERQALKLLEEMGEVAGALIKGRQPNHPRQEEALASLGPEIADVLIVLCALAVKAELDLEEEVEAKLKKLPNWDKYGWEVWKK